jgi:hypothetical protein
VTVYPRERDELIALLNHAQPVVKCSRLQIATARRACARCAGGARLGNQIKKSAAHAAAKKSALGRNSPADAAPRESQPFSIGAAHAAITRLDMNVPFRADGR